jgi:hypothetical protein
MVRKAESVNQGDPRGQTWTVFMRKSPKSRPRGSQSAHSSDEAGQRPWSEGSAGRWMRNDEKTGKPTDASAGNG